MFPDEIRIDHVTIAGRELSQLEARFSDVGIDPDYGGEHDSLPTHMSIVGFDDGTYIELIAKHDPDEPSAYWDAEIDGDAGPCAWAVRTVDVEQAAERIRQTGIAVNGPRPFSRDRPDGTTAEWKLAFLGEGDPGEVLPFLIEDVTPRYRRVEPTPSVSGSELAGVGAVVIAVADLDSAIESFRTAFDLPAPDRTTVDEGPFAGSVADFDGLPAYLHSPADDEGHIAARLERFGDGPCVHLLRTTDLEATADRFGSLRRCSIGPREVHLIKPVRLGGIEHVGVVPG